jgi:hypothetical protein
MAFCRFCKQEFLTYTPGRLAYCPICGRRAHTASQQRVLRLIALALLLTIVLSAVCVFLLRR